VYKRQGVVQEGDTIQADWDGKSEELSLKLKKKKIKQEGKEK